MRSCSGKRTLYSRADGSVNGQPDRAEPVNDIETVAVSIY